MTDKIFLLLSAMLPTLALLSFFMYSDKFVEPKKNVLSTFILGIFIIAPLQVFYYATIMILGEPINYNPFLKHFLKLRSLRSYLNFVFYIFKNRIRSSNLLAIK